MNDIASVFELELRVLLEGTEEFVNFATMVSDPKRTMLGVLEGMFVSAGCCDICRIAARHIGEPIKKKRREESPSPPACLYMSREGRLRMFERWIRRRRCGHPVFPPVEERSVLLVLYLASRTRRAPETDRLLDNDKEEREGKLLACANAVMDSLCGGRDRLRALPPVVPCRALRSDRLQNSMTGTVDSFFSLNPFSNQRRRVFVDRLALLPGELAAMRQELLSKWHDTESWYSEDRERYEHLFVPSPFGGAQYRMYEVFFTVKLLRVFISALDTGKGEHAGELAAMAEVEARRWSMAADLRSYILRPTAAGMAAVLGTLDTLSSAEEIIKSRLPHVDCATFCSCSSDPSICRVRLLLRISRGLSEHEIADLLPGESSCRFDFDNQFTHRKTLLAVCEAVWFLFGVPVLSIERGGMRPWFAGDVGHGVGEHDLFWHRMSYDKYKDIELLEMLNSERNKRIS